MMEYKTLPEGGIVILGGGPCGGAVALGLRRLGYEVTLIAEPRQKLVIEGLSENTLSQMKKAGFSFALRNLPASGNKHIIWNGESHTRAERLCNRTEMDKDILLDLISAGVHVIEGRAGRIAAYGNGYQVEVSSSDKMLLIPSSYIVEARGRSAPVNQLERIRGEDTISLQYFWRDNPVQPCSVLESFSDGFIWLASWNDGSRYAQITLDAKQHALPVKSRMAEFCQHQLMQLSDPYGLTESVPVNGCFSARASTPVLCLDSVSENWIRIGDAALALDPLTESCLAYSLQCAMVVPAVINTLIQKPEHTDIARQFYSEFLHYQFVSIGRSNRERYASEQQWQNDLFWQSRRVWPDVEWAYPSTVQNRVWVEERPVQAGDFIEMTEVVVSKDQPLGIRDLQGVPLVA